MSDAVNLPEGEERRRAPRAALLRLNATIREPGRSRTQVRVIDISLHGCRIEAISGPSADSWVLLSIAGLDTQYCRVVWQCHEFAGLEFATPLAEVVLDRLLEDQQQLPEAAIKELHQIANRTHRLAQKLTDEDKRPLAELSHNCALDALVEGLRLGETGRPAAPKGPRPL